MSRKQVLKLIEEQKKICGDFYEKSSLTKEESAKSKEINYKLLKIHNSLLEKVKELSDQLLEEEVKRVFGFEINRDAYLSRMHLKKNGQSIGYLIYGTGPDPKHNGFGIQNGDEFVFIDSAKPLDPIYRLTWEEHLLERFRVRFHEIAKENA